MNKEVEKLFLLSIFLVVVFLSVFFFLNWIEAKTEGVIIIESTTKHKSFNELINAFLDFLLKLALAIAPLTIVIAGYFFITSAGNPEQVNTARKIIIYTLVGLLIILLSKGIITLLQQEVFKTKK